MGDALIGASTYLRPADEELLRGLRDRLERGRGQREAAARIVAALLVAAGAVAFLALPAGRGTSLWLLVSLTAVYALASRVHFEVGTGAFVPTEVVFVPMLLLLPSRVVPAAVVAAMVAANLPGAVRRRISWVTFTAIVGSAAFAFLPAAAALALGEPGARQRDWPLVVLLLAAQFAGDALTAAARDWAALGVRPGRLAPTLRWVFTVDALLAPLGLAVAAAATTAPLAVLLPVSGLLVFRWFARERQAAVTSSLELSSAYRGTAHLLGDVVEADDAYTGAHSRAVVEMTLAVADQLGLSDADRRLAEFSALLHDVGKIRVPNEIIRKPGSLTPAERAVVERHTIHGEALLSTVGGLLADVGRVVRSCHERWDGAGYPDGLAGEEIPLVARIVGCADAFDAMASDRPYRAALPLPAIVDELRRCSGSQFDPQIVEHVLSLLESDSHWGRARVSALRSAA
jgi:HD-GYP domain-containing protein (c-di-GMP phosphodiesterase class II)